MINRPWLKFYPRDWRGDQALRAVSMAARGFWMECLCIMHEAKPYGHLLLNGERIGDDALARMTGATVDEVSAWIAELRKAGVLSVSRGGVVHSRRMVRDDATSKKGAQAVSKRWEQATEKPKESPRPNRGPSIPPSTQKPEARSQKDTSPPQQQPVTGSEGRSDGPRGERFERGSADELEARLREAAGYQTSPAPGLFVTGPMAELIAEGFDLEREILPTIRAKAMALTRPAQSWSFFVGAIRDARDRANRAPTTARRGGDVADRERISAELAEARRRLAKRPFEPEEA